MGLLNAGPKYGWLTRQIAIQVTIAVSLLGGDFWAG